MKRVMLHGLGLFSLGALVAALAMAPAQAAGAKDKDQPDPTKGRIDVQLAAQSAQFNASAIRLMKRKAMAHKPLAMEDPKTKKKYGPDEMITTPGGKKVKASEYFAELNKLEKKLNEMGHSLRDPEKKVVLAQSEVKDTELDQKAKAITTSHLKFNAQTMKAVMKRATLETRHAEELKKDEPRVAAVKKLVPVKATAAMAAVKPVAPKGTTKTWHWELGKRSLVAGALDARLETLGSTEQVRVRGEASADGYLVNRRLNLVKATGVATVPRAGASTLNVSVNVLGRTVYNKNVSKSTSFTQKDELSKTFDQNVSFRFQLGPIPMKVKMGARGTAGIRYFVGVRPLSAEAQFVPFIRSEAYAQAGIDIVVAGAGVGGKLRLIDVELRIGGELVVKFDQSSRPQMTEHAYVQSNIRMLNGSLYVYADVNVLFWKKHYQWDLWKWKGFSTSGYLVNVHKTHNLY